MDKLRASPWFMLAIVTLAYLCSGADRFVLTLLVVPIKTALHLSDTQVGLLQGLAFLLVYSLAGIPAGYLVDRMHRIRLLCASVVAWTAMSLGCAFAQQFVQLLIGRGGVAIGEATIVPTFYSLLGDRFAPKQRGLAIGLHLGITTLVSGVLLLVGGRLVAGLVAHGPIRVPHLGVFAPWQTTIAIFGAPGLIIAPLVLLLKEPKRHDDAETAHAPVGLAEFYRRNASTVILHHLALGMCGLIVNALMVWGSPFMMRVHHWTLLQVAPVVGTAFLGASVGLFGGGMVSDRLARIGDRARFLFWSTVAFMGAVTAAAFPVTADGALAVALFGVTVFLANLPYGGAVAALNEIIDNRIRGRVAALFGLNFSVFSSVGALLVGVLNDRLFAGPMGIRLSLEAILPAAFAIAAVTNLFLMGPFRRSQQHQRRRSAPLGPALAEAGLT